MDKKTLKIGARIMIMRYNAYRGVDFIRAHNEAIDETGSCWMLKLGKTVSTASLKQTIEDGGGLVLRSPKSEGENYYVCHLYDYHNGYPVEGMLYPSYYSTLFKREGIAPNGTWLKIGPIVKLSDEEVEGMKLLKNGKPLRVALQETRTVVLFVYNDKELELPE